MTNGVRVETNLPDFKRQLRDVSLEMQRKAARNATASAAAVFRAAVRRNAAAPKATEPARPRTGTLARAVYMTYSRRKSTAGKVVFTVSVRSGRGQRKGKAGNVNTSNGDAYYWRWLEGGWIPRGRKGALRGGSRSKALQRSRMAGSRIAYPFIAPAFRSAGSSALAAFNKRMATEVAKLSRIK